jgi:hypothetical protein
MHHLDAGELVLDFGLSLISVTGLRLEAGLNSYARLEAPATLPPAPITTIKLCLIGVM